jgi:predicted HTH domain antitoxin
MATQMLTLEAPEELVALLGSPEAAAARAKQALVLDLLREARISQGRAAALLGLTRRDILDLMVQYEIPSGPETAEELREEVDNLRRLLQQS